MSTLRELWGRWLCRKGWHSWRDQHPYRCSRCRAKPKSCRNCGGIHNPRAITICSVTKGGW